MYRMLLGLTVVSVLLCLVCAAFAITYSDRLAVIEARTQIYQEMTDQRLETCERQHLLISTWIAEHQLNIMEQVEQRAYAEAP